MNETALGAPPANARRRLRALVERRDAVLVPGAPDAMTARIIEDLGFEAVYLTGAGLANAHLGMPDIGLVSMTELSDTASRISDVCTLPLIVDIDTGFGNALNVYRTVRMLERAGAAAMQLEDQTFPKKCGHFAGKQVVPLPEMLTKLNAALDARSSPDMLIIARTDARAVMGFDHALERADAFARAGADVVFLEAPTSKEELRTIGQLDKPQVANLVAGGHTPMLTQEELRGFGFAIALYANAALQASIKAMQTVLSHLKAEGSLAGVEDQLATFIERQRVVGKASYDALEVRYATD
jgi:2-methylisocitrate lyase-like PEP mutase family enzyme